jgi:hypothetical protein
MPIFLFGCLDIQKPDLILWLNVKCYLDGQSEQLRFYRALITNLLYRYIHVQKYETGTALHTRNNKQIIC